MKKILIILGILAIAGGFWYFTKDQAEIVAGPEVVIENPTDTIPAADSKYTKEEAVAYLDEAMLTLSSPAPKPNRALFGDINGDKQINISDLTKLVSILKTGETNWKADLDGNCKVNWDDLVYFADWFFKGGPTPVKPCRIPKPIE